ncbi:MAG: hypothetical protein JSW00_06580 [Thermoplasmata archaeon]|nr:MAG: hypothetical protein JSW00_06580 [Thermoplasmata archaeon]
MKIRFKQILTLYFNSWWFPAVFFLAELAVFTRVTLSPWRPMHALARVLFDCLVIAFLGILSASIWNIIKKRWVKAVVNLVMLPVCVVATFFVFDFLMAVSPQFTHPD